MSWAFTYAGVIFDIVPPSYLGLNLLQSVDLSDPVVQRTVDHVKANFPILCTWIELKTIAADVQRIQGCLEKKIEVRATAAPYATRVDYVRELIAILDANNFIAFPGKWHQLPDQIQSLDADLRTYHERQRLLDLSRRFPKEHAGYVYLFKLSTGHYKIGLSINPQRRSRELTSGLPLTIETIHTIWSNQISCLESELHKLFIFKRYQGTEWFSLSDEDVQKIKAIERREYEWINNPEWWGIPTLPPVMRPSFPKHP